MGRKIPGRKHRGVKDPEKQAAERLNSIRDKINAPPTNPDIQEISKSLQRIIDLKNQTKSGEFKVKKKKKPKVIKKPDDEDTAKPNKGNIRDRVFERLPNESDREFLHRINKICQNVTREAAFENKYGVDIKRDEAGEVKVVKRPKDELEVFLKKVKKEKAQKKVKKKKSAENIETPKLTKSQKWQKKKNDKKVKKKLKVTNEFVSPRDQVGFGEIVHAPPTLTVPKKIQKVIPRPGQKKLLLSAILEKSEEGIKSKNSVALAKVSKTTNKKATKSPGVTKKIIDKKGKRKDLPIALRRQLDKQQKEVIESYKQLKSQKYDRSV